MTVHGHSDLQKRERLLRALRAGYRVTCAARYAGMQRTYIYPLSRSWSALAEELARVPARSRAVMLDSDAEALDLGAPTCATESAVTEARLRHVGLTTLAEIAQNPEAADKDRVAAAKALAAATATKGERKVTKDTEAPSAPPPAEQDPLTAEQVAAALRVRPRREA